MTPARISRVAVLFLLAGVVTATPILRADDAPASQPTTQPGEPKLPSGAIRRLGDLRFADIGSHGGFFSPDNKRLISFGDDLVIWDVATGFEIGRYSAPDQAMSQAAYFGEGRIAVACNASKAGKSNEIIVVEEKTGALIRKIDHPFTGPIGEFVAAADGSRFAVITDHILLCDGQTGQTIRDLGARPPVTGGMAVFPGARIGFSGDGKTFLAVSYDGEAHVIDSSTGHDKFDHTFTATQGASISSDGNTLATVPDDHDLHLIDLPTGEEMPVPSVAIVMQPDQPAERFAVQHLTFARHGGMLAYTYAGPGINVLNTSERPMKLPRRIAPPGVGGVQPVLSDDGSLLAIQNGNTGRRIILSTQTGKPVSPAILSMQMITAMTISPDGQELLAGNLMSELYRWDLQQGNLLTHRDRFTATDFYRGGIFRLSYFDQGKMVLEGGPADTRECDPKTLVTEHRLAHQFGLGSYSGIGVTNYAGMNYGMMNYAAPGLVISPDARWTVQQRMSNEGSNLELTDRKTNTTTIVQHQDRTNYGGVTQLFPGAISPDGTLLYAGSPEGPRIVDLLTHKAGPVVRDGNFQQPSAGHVRFSPDSRWVVMHVGQANALYEARKLTQMPDADTTDTVAPPMNRVIVNGRPAQPTAVSKVPPVWKIPTGNLMEGDADFSSSSELIAILDGSAAPGTQPQLTVFETRTGKPVLTFPDFVPTATAVRFVPRKLQMVTADRAGTILLWDLRSLLLADKDLSAEQAKTDDQLWTSLTDPDPVTAYRAGLVLMDHHQLATRASALSPLPGSDIRSNAANIHQMIQSLSSAVTSDREKAHKALEAAGPAAVGEVRAALELHPGGELEDRLKDIAHVIGADDPSISVPTALPSTAPIADPETLRAARVIQLLEWSDDPRAVEQYSRLKPSGENLSN